MNKELLKIVGAICLLLGIAAIIYGGMKLSKKPVKTKKNSLLVITVLGCVFAILGGGLLYSEFSTSSSGYYYF
jgi:prolipoprotein diacylglyceryltransferase